MNSIERFYATIERKPVDRPACWLGDPTLDAVPALCDYYGVRVRCAYVPYLTFDVLMLSADSCISVNCTHFIVPFQY